MSPIRVRDEMDDLVGRPFVTLPGSDAEHRVLGEYGGVKIRSGAVMQVFNDMLLIDAIRGAGKFRSTVQGLTAEALRVAEREYGSTCEEALPKWMGMGKPGRAVEWPR